MICYTPYHSIKGTKLKHKDHAISHVSVSIADVTNNIGEAVAIDLKECGKSKGCFRYPTGCDHDCEHIVSWRPVGDDVLFELEAKITEDNDGGSAWFWTAVGFSRDQNMVSVMFHYAFLYS